MTDSSLNETHAQSSRMSTHSILNYQNRCEAEVKLKVLEHKSTADTGTSTVLYVTGSERCGVAASGAELLEVRPMCRGGHSDYSQSLFEA